METRLAFRDQRYGSIIDSRRLGRAMASVPLPVLIGQGGPAFKATEKEGRAAVRQRARLGRLIADLSVSFVDLPASCVGAVIEDSLRLVVETLGIELAALCRSTDDGLAVEHASRIEGFEEVSVIKQEYALTGMAQSLRGKGAIMLSKQDAPSEETGEKEFLARFGLRSAVLVGVMRGGSLLGALMLGSSQEEIVLGEEQAQQLDILGAVLVGALARKRVEETLIETDRLSRAMLDSLESHIIILDKCGEVIAANAGKRFVSKSDAPVLTSISAGANYLDMCRLAFEGGFDAAEAVLSGVEAVIDGSQESFEMEYEWLSPSGRKVFRVSATPLEEGAVISHIETTAYGMAQANLRELSGKVIRSLEEERARIARDLHDDLSQRLALMGIELEQIMQSLPGKRDDLRNRLRGLWGRNQEISSEVRRLSHQLHPSKLEYLGLVAAVRGFCDELSQLQGLRIKFKQFNVPSVLPKDEAICIYRVVQESLRNVVKHSGAREAQVVLSGSNGAINLCISDEGAGFDPSSAKARTGIGLIGMRERLLLIGGDISIDSQPSRGTRIVVRVPLNQQACDANVPSVSD